MEWVAVVAFGLVGVAFMYIVYEVDRHKTE